MPGARELEDRVREYESLLVGYSGGVDSALVAVTACQTLGRTRVIAALGVSASLSTEQYEQAHDVARCSLLDSNKPVRESLVGPE